MKTPRFIWASLVALFAACLVHAADSKLPARVIAILDIETVDPTGYANWAGQYNQVAKARLGVDPYLRVFQTHADGRKTGRIRVSVAAKSFAELMQQAQTLDADPGVQQLVTNMSHIRQLGARTIYQAVRFEGSDKGVWIYGTLAVVNDEAGYLKALDQLRSILDGAGLKDARINVYRIIAGRTDHTHRINITLPSADRMAAFLDFVGTNAQGAEWIASTAKYRTVVSNATSREITK